MIVSCQLLVVSYQLSVISCQLSVVSYQLLVLNSQFSNAVFNKYVFLMLLLGSFTPALFSQQTDYETIVQPVENKARDFKEYLVQLAWLNNPESLIAQNELKNARDEDKNTRKEWLKDVQATFNLNEANIKNTTGNNAFFPRYNFGLGLNVFNLTSQKAKNKISKREIDIAQQKTHQQKLALRAETLTRYARLKLARNIYKQKVLAEQEIYANYVLIKQLFETDEETFEKYTAASNAYYAAQEAKLKAEAEVLTTQYALEEIIGLQWDQVQHPEKDAGEK